MTIKEIIYDILHGSYSLNKVYYGIIFANSVLKYLKTPNMFSGCVISKTEPECIEWSNGQNDIIDLCYIL